MAPYSFFVGDKVKIVEDNCGHSVPIGTEVVITAGSSYYDRYYQNYNTCYVEGRDIKKINSNSMTIKEKFLLAFKTEPEKSFRKAGITNGDDLLTEEGQVIFLSWLLKKSGEEFKKEVVDGLLAEEKE